MPTSGLREKPKSTVRIVATIAAILWAVLIFIGSSIPNSGFPSHPNILNVIAHFCEYLVFAVLLTLAINSPTRALWKTALIAVIIASVYAISDEVHQYLSNIYFASGRQGDPLDWLTDTLGALTGSAAAVWFISSQKVKKSRARDAEKKGHRNQ